MLSFLAKKAFFDGWDHLLALVLLNGGFLLFLSLGLLASVVGLPGILVVLLLGLAWFGLCWWYAVTALATLRWSDYRDFPLADLPAALRQALLPGLQLALILAADAAALVVGIPFYLTRGIVGAAAAGLLLWFSLALLLALQFYLPLRFRLGGGFAKNFRKSFILLIDNPGYALIAFGWSLVSLAVSAFLAFLAPGLTGMALFQNSGLRLRLLKYDWLENQAAADGTPGADSRKLRRRIPWKELFVDEQELLGKRTLKGMIFPWRE